MPAPSFEFVEKQKVEWTDRFVVVNPEREELKRFAGRVGRVVTVNWNGKAIVDFADGAWYDIPAHESHLVLQPASAGEQFDAKANSAQPRPERQS